MSTYNPSVLLHWCLTTLSLQHDSIYGLNCCSNGSFSYPTLKYVDRDHHNQFPKCGTGMTRRKVHLNKVLYNSVHLNKFTHFFSWKGIQTLYL